MTREILAVSESDLGEVIRVIRAGLFATKNTVTMDTRAMLENWCDKEEYYLIRFGGTVWNENEELDALQ